MVLLAQSYAQRNNSAEEMCFHASLHFLNLNFSCIWIANFLHKDLNDCIWMRFPSKGISVFHMNSHWLWAQSIASINIRKLHSQLDSTWQIPPHRATFSSFLHIPCYSTTTGSHFFAFEWFLLRLEYFGLFFTATEKWLHPCAKASCGFGFSVVITTRKAIDWSTAP